jgi:hypothetical protein
MKHKVLRTKNPIAGGYTYITVVVDTANKAYWSGYYMILSNAFEPKNPITHYTLETNRVLMNLEDAIPENSFMRQVVDHARCAFEGNFFEANQELYMSAMMRPGGIEYIESEEEDAFNSILLNCTDKQTEIVEKFLNAAFSEELSLKIRMAQKLREALRIKPID